MQNLRCQNESFWAPWKCQVGRCAVPARSCKNAQGVGLKHISEKVRRNKPTLYAELCITHKHPVLRRPPFPSGPKQKMMALEAPRCPTSRPLGAAPCQHGPRPGVQKKSRRGAVSIFKIGPCDDTPPSVRGEERNGTLNSKP